MKANLVRAVVCCLALAIVSPGALDAQSTVPQSVQVQAAPIYSAAQIDQLLAPIALYPDTLIAEILAASTYPLEVIEAYRWQQEDNNANLRGDQLDAALQDKDWDPSVKSLVAFPQVLRMMNDRLDWMEMLGDAFLAQQADVMDSIQRLRRAAENAGSLKSSPQQTVTTQDQAIIVAPAEAGNIYVPVYDPTVVYGVWPYPAYPPYYYWPPDFVFGPAFWPGWWWWWPPVAVVYYGPYWAWGYCDWHNHSIFVNHERYDHIAGRHPAAFSGNAWQHDPYHRRGVAYRDAPTAAKFGRPVGAPDARRPYRGHLAAPAVSPQGGQKPPVTAQPQVQRGTTAPRGPGVQAAPTAPSAQTGQRPTAPVFGGYGRGADVRAQSDRGRASQQTAAPRNYGGGSSGFRPPSASGGTRSSGGGGRQR